MNRITNPYTRHSRIANAAELQTHSVFSSHIANAAEPQTHLAFSLGEFAIRPQ
jgi:hypothetical protein